MRCPTWQKSLNVQRRHRSVRLRAVLCIFGTRVQLISGTTTAHHAATLEHSPFLQHVWHLVHSVHSHRLHRAGRNFQGALSLLMLCGCRPAAVRLLL